MKRILLTIALAVSLSSCAWASSTIEDFFPSCENKVYAIDTGIYITAGTTAHLYTGKPLCGSPKAVPGKLCSEIAPIRVIKSAEQTADLAIKAAKKACTESTLKAVITATQAYSDIADSFKPKE